jgi:hypothetical protein
MPPLALPEDHVGAYQRRVADVRAAGSPVSQPVACRAGSHPVRARLVRRPECDHLADMFVFRPRGDVG